MHNKWLVIICLFAFIGCDAGLESNFESGNKTSKIINEKNKSTKAELDKLNLIGIYRGKVERLDGTDRSFVLEVHIRRFYDAIRSDGGESALINIKAILLTPAPSSGAPTGGIRLVDVAYIIEERKIFLSGISQPGSSTIGNYGLFVAEGTIEASGISFQEMYDHLGPIKPSFFKKVGD